MSIASTTNRVQYSITGASSSPLTIPFRYDEPGWLMVFYVADNSQDAVTLVNGADFNLSTGGESGSSALTLTAGFLEDVSIGALTIVRRTPALQDLNLQYNQRLPAELLERALDRATMEIQDRDVDPDGMGSRAVMFPLTEPAGNSNVLDIPNNRISRVWGGDSTGKMVFLNAQQLSNLVLGFIGGPPTTQDYLSAIAAIAPLRLTEPPTNATLAQFGQLAIVSGSIQVVPEDSSPFSIEFYDPNPLNDLVKQSLSDAGERTVYTADGPVLMRSYSVSGVNPGDSSAPPLDLWVRADFDFTSGGTRWIIGGFIGGIYFAGWVSDALPSHPSQVSSWTAYGANVTGEVSLQFAAPQIWINTSNGLIPQWQRILSLSDLHPSSLPPFDPEVKGLLFRDGTELHVSLGPP